MDNQNQPLQSIPSDPAPINRDNNAQGFYRKTNWKFIAIVVVLGLVAVGGILLLHGFQRESFTPQSSSQDTIPPQVRKSFATQEECEAQTGYRCDFVNCDINCPVSFQKGWSATDVKIEQPIDSSNWQTYRNEEFGYEIQYPEGYQISDISNYPKVVSLGETFEHNIFITVSEEPMMLGFHGTWGPILQSETSQKVTSSKEVQINGALFTKNYWSAGPTTLTAFTNHKEKVYTLSFAVKLKGEEETRVFDQILSTFRFIGQKMKQADDQNSCEKQGGKWQKAGAIQESMCIFTYADGGKKCTSSDECEGDCIVTQDSQTTGFCKQNTNPFGCFSTIESVKKGNGILCRD